MDAARDNLIQPLLMGPEGKIRAVAEEHAIRRWPAWPMYWWRRTSRPATSWPSS
jgi:hypothetical protein